MRGSALACSGLSFCFLVGGLRAVPLLAAQAADPQVLRVEDPLVVSVSASPVPQSESTAAVIVVNEEEIRNAHADTVGDLLGELPFVHVSRPGHGGALTTATIRGGDPNHTLVLIDGVPLNDPTNILGGSYDLSALSTDNVTRIEIVRGPMSSIYGSAASAGVVNVITSPSRDAPELEVEGMIGNPSGTDRVRVGGGGRFGSTEFSAGGSYLRRDGTEEGVGSSLGVVSLGARTTLEMDRTLDWLIRFQDQESTVFPENGGGPEHSILSTLKDSRARETVWGVAYNDQLTPDWDLRLSWDLFDRRQETDTPAILDGIPPSFASQPSIESGTDFLRNRIRAMNSWRLGDWMAHAGFSVEEERGTSAAVIAGVIPSDFELIRTTFAGTGEVDYTSSLVNLNFNVRVDKLDGLDLEVSPGIGAVVSLPDSSARIRASWARAFKAPSFFAIGDPLVGNSLLRPETTHGFDVGVENVSLGSTMTPTFSLTYFRNDFNDLIDFSPSQFQMVNRADAMTQGVELLVAVQVAAGASVEGHVSYLDWSLGEGVDEPLRDRPRWRGGVSLSLEPYENAHLDWDTVWVGPRFDFQVPVPAEDVVGGYSTTSLAFTQTIDRLDLFVRIENLFDREYHEFIGFPDPGFAVRFGGSFGILN